MILNQISFFFEKKKKKKTCLIKLYAKAHSTLCFFMKGYRTLFVEQCSKKTFLCGLKANKKIYYS